MSKENVILIDYDAPKEWEFHKAIENTTREKWRIYKAVSNENHGGILQKVIRYVKYFWVPIKIVKNYENYSKILAWQQFYGLVLAFYFRLLNIKNAPEIVVMTFIYKPKKAFVGKAYDKFMKYIVTSGYIKYFVVFSKNEKIRYAEYFGISESKFVSEKLGYEDKTQEVSPLPSEDFYLAAGRSNRDYNFLITSWRRRKEQLKIICDTLSEQDTENNIKILTNCHGVDYFTELAKCKAVIVPLEDTHISSGQLVIIQAMMYGKPIIVTENDAVRDYVDSGRTGVVIEKTEEALSEAMLSLTNELYYNAISVAERNKYESDFSVYAMGVAIGKLMN